MSIEISPNLPANVVEIGNEITQAKINEINSGTLALQSWVTSGFLGKSGGILTTGSYLTQNDEFNFSTLNGGSGLIAGLIADTSVYAQLHKDFITIQTSTGNVTITSTGITFPDSTTQTTAYTGGGGGGGGGSGTVTYTSPNLYDTVGASNITSLSLGSGSFDANQVTGGNCVLSGTGLALTASSGANITFQDGTIQSTAYIAGGGGGGVNVQTFGSPTTSGNFTWTKPAGAKYIEVWLYGGGGGGGSGARQATTVGRCGGGGGGGTGLFCGRIGADAVPSSVTVTVGAGGAGGASKTVDTSIGSTSGVGGNTSFGTIFRSYGGGLASGGTTTNGIGASWVGSSIFLAVVTTGNTGAGGQLTNGSTLSSTNTTYVSGGGGGGGGAGASSTTAASGGNSGGFSNGGSYSGLFSNIAGGSGGTTAGVQATSGTSAVTDSISYAGTGGGGGFYRTGQAGGTGGNGGWPGGGGGGGGASDNGFASGAGGTGANGLAVIITYF